MIAGDRTGFMGEQPPTAITRFALGEAGVERPSVAASRIAPFTHLAFGALGGAVFGLLRRLSRAPRRTARGWLRARRLGR